MEIHHLRILSVLVADPNLTRAAERLRLTQSALSKRVQAIEEELGVKLFERRGPRGLAPLPQAVELAQLADRIADSWETGLKKVQSVALEPQHLVLVGPQLFLREIVLPWWNRIGAEFPELQLEVRVSPLARVSLETVQAGADAGILEHREELPDYVCRPIYTEQWGIVRNPETASLPLAKYRWGTVSGHDNPVEHWLVRRQKISPPRYRVFWQDLKALAYWVAAEPGTATVLPWHTAAWQVRNRRLLFEPLGPEAKTTLYLAYRRNNPHKRFLKRLSEISDEHEAE